MQFALLPGLGRLEVTVLLILGLLLFGRRLIDVGRHLGKGGGYVGKGLRVFEGWILDQDVQLDPVASAAEPDNKRGGEFLLMLLVVYLVALVVAVVAMKIVAS